jgi:hypothetical protein
MSVEIELDDFDEDEIIAHVVKRRLVQQVLEADAVRQNQKHKPKPVVRDIAADAYADLMARRLGIAAAALRTTIEMTVPADLFAAYEAARDGQRDEAICRLDDYLHRGSFPTKEVA